MARLLIIEDDPVMLRMYRKVFVFEGFEVVVAADGAEGLEKARTQKLDVVLLDVMMPKMNGMEVLERLKRDAKTKDVPIIMLTNLTSTHDVKAMLARGAVRHIPKAGHEPQEVVRIVTEVLSDSAHGKLSES
jgi:DNA-binding response OmpR family regulator